jgi:hypothetical protein
LEVRLGLFLASSAAAALASSAAAAEALPQAVAHTQAVAEAAGAEQYFASRNTPGSATGFP